MVHKLNDIINSMDNYNSWIDVPYEIDISNIAINEIDQFSIWFSRFDYNNNINAANGTPFTTTANIIYDTDNSDNQNYVNQHQQKSLIDPIYEPPTLTLDSNCNINTV